MTKKLRQTSFMIKNCMANIQDKIFKNITHKPTHAKVVDNFMAPTAPAGVSRAPAKKLS